TAACAYQRELTRFVEDGQRVDARRTDDRHEWIALSRRRRRAHFMEQQVAKIDLREQTAVLVTAESRRGEPQRYVISEVLAERRAAAIAVVGGKHDQRAVELSDPREVRADGIEIA